jgi:hypothetical protein
VAISKNNEAKKVIVGVDFINENGVSEISPIDSRFVIYSIEYSRSESGPKMTVYLSEVL